MLPRSCRHLNGNSAPRLLLSPTEAIAPEAGLGNTGAEATRALQFSLDGGFLSRHQSRPEPLSQYLLFPQPRIRNLLGGGGGGGGGGGAERRAAPLIALPSPSRAPWARQDSCVASVQARGWVGAPSGQVGGAGDAAAAAEFLCSTFGIASDGAEIPPPASPPPPPPEEALQSPPARQAAPPPPPRGPQSRPAAGEREPPPGPPAAQCVGALAAAEPHPAAKLSRPPLPPLPSPACLPACSGFSLLPLAT